MAKPRKTKALSSERADAARRFIRAIVDRDFGGVVWAFTKELDVAQASISDFLNEKAGIGINVIEKIADYETEQRGAHVTIDEVLGRSGFPVSSDLSELREQLQRALADVEARLSRRSPSGFPPSPVANKVTPIAKARKKDR
jgi:hypothetical protein